MRPETIKADILEQLTLAKGKPLSSGTLRNAIGLAGKAAKRVQKCLDQLVHEGHIVRLRKDQYAFGTPEDVFAGKLDVLRSGDGLLRPPAGGPEIFIDRGDVGNALPGDHVMVRLLEGVAPPAGRPLQKVGKIIRVVERSKRDIVGTLRNAGRFFCVIPLDPSYKRDFYVADTKGAAEGDRVIVRLTEWVNEHVSPEGEIVEVIGPSDQPSLDTVTVVRNCGIRQEFPAAVLHEAETAVNRLDEAGERLDLRERYIITIDPVRARDFDDALSMDVDAAGNRVLGVHIADVSHFVTVGSALDEEARQRGNSVYFPDQVIPMLPEQLSNGVCSLQPNVDRLAFSVFITVDSQGRTVGRHYARSVIRSRARLTYEQAMEGLLHSGAERIEGRTAGRPDGMSDETLRLLAELHRLARQFRKARFARDALDLDMPECEIVIDRDGRMTGIRVVVNDASHQLVEECMVAANEAVAIELQERGYPQLYRIHEPPAEDKIEAVMSELTDMGLSPGNLHHRHNLATFLKSVANDPRANDARLAVLKSLNRAVYSPLACEHFGLAKEAYSHFTSPIRRYPDLVVHRQLGALLDSGSRPARGTRPAPRRRDGVDTRAVIGCYSRDELIVVAAACTETERVADEAERTLLEIKKYRYLAEQLKNGKPQEYDAVIVHVANFGMFVEIPDLVIQGLVHVSALSDRFVKYDRNKRTLRAGRKLYVAGGKVRVIVANVDFEKRRIDFTLGRQQ